MDQISHTLDVLMQRMDVLEECSCYDDHGVERRMPQRRGGSRGSEDDGEVYMGGVRRQVPRFEHAHQCDQGIHTEPLDEVTKRMKVKVSDFLEGLIQMLSMIGS